MLTIKSSAQKWDTFFFKEQPTEGMALFRMLWMGLVLMGFIVDLGNINDFYGPHALISLETVRNEFPFVHANLFHMFNPSYQFTYGLMTVYGIAILASFIGLYTRTSLVVVLLCMTSLHQRNIWLLGSSELLLRLMTIMLIFSPCGHSLSVDSILRRRSPISEQKRIWPLWTWRLIQIQVSVIYLWTVWHKLKGETWLDGTAVYYATRIESLTNFTLPYAMDSMFVLKLISYGTILVEAALGVCLWFNKSRKVMIGLGILFHLSIQYFMSIPYFQLYMIVLLCNFFQPLEVKFFVDRVINSFIQGIQESEMGVELKGRIVRALRGQHETAN